MQYNINVSIEAEVFGHCLDQQLLQNPRCSLNFIQITIL